MTSYHILDGFPRSTGASEGSFGLRSWEEAPHVLSGHLGVDQASKSRRLWDFPRVKKFLLLVRFDTRHLGVPVPLAYLLESNLVDGCHAGKYTPTRAFIVSHRSTCHELVGIMEQCGVRLRDVVLEVLCVRT